MQGNTVLGISVGTRRIGIAIIKNNMLIEWQIKIFNGKWSRKKLKRILHTLTQFIQGYHIHRIALYTPNQYRSSKGIDKIVSRLSQISEDKNIMIHTYSIDELKRHCGRKNKKELMEYATERFPELKNVFTKQVESKNTYHIKLFEATVIAEMVISRN